MITHPEAVDSTLVDTTTIYGRMIEETCVFVSRETKTVVDPVVLLGITGTISPDASVKQLYFPNDAIGYIGLRPGLEEREGLNFLENLQYNGDIEHQVFALFIDLKEGFHTHLKLGDYDSDTLKSGERIHFFNTVSKTNWDLKVTSITLNDSELINTPKTLEFYPNMPWIYLPSDDFSKVADIVNQLHKEANPDEKDICYTNECIFEYGCREVLKMELSFQIPEIGISLNFEEMLIEGEKIDEAMKGFCYLPFFKQMDQPLSASKTW